MRRAVIIEDDEDVRDYLQGFLSNRGWDAHVAADGTAGLEEIRRFRPALVILDLMMPETDGFSVLRRLANQGMEDRPRVIVVTAVDRPQGREEAMRLGADAFLFKPVEVDALSAEVARLFPESAGSARAS